MRLWQNLVYHWNALVFGEKLNKITPHIRCLRILEETLELCQTENVTIEEIQIITKQVYDKPVGHPIHETGGIMICILGYCVDKGFDLEELIEMEYKRIIHPDIINKVRYRNLEGDKIGFNKEVK